jgi:hypothetical protein
MKKLFKNLVVASSLLISIVFFNSCSKSVNNLNTENNGDINKELLQSQINSLPKEDLNADELASIAYLREEEKLARDVYTTLYNKWGANPFTNIAKSEQTHMDAVLLLLNKYGLPDPVGSNVVGKFANIDLQNLYNKLVSDGNVSLLEAYKVGATIEDLDIFDLNNALKKIDNQDIKLVFDNLNKGSRNHMRSFYKNILNSGGSYTPQFISQLDFDAIINSAMER